MMIKEANDTCEESFHEKTMISIENVTYTYQGGKQPALKNINLRIRDGETVLLTGRSGSGKSTILRLINGLLLNDTEDDEEDEESGRNGPSADNLAIEHGMDEKEVAAYSDSRKQKRKGSDCDGRIIINGRDIRDMEMWEIAKIIGTVFQNPKSQFFNIDTTDEILFGLESMGASHEKMEETLKKVTEDLNLVPLLDRNIFNLSGGEKQRIAFASIYAMDPEVYVLDEPSSNLDEDGILRLRENIIRVKGTGKTVVIAEHRLWYAADLADEVYYIDEGEIRERWTGKDFLALSEQERIRLGLRSRSRTLLQAKDPDDSDGSDRYSDPLLQSSGAGTSLGRNDHRKSGAEKNNDNGRGIPDGLSVRKLSASYRRRKVWGNLHFDFYKGEIIAVVGHNGAGKSTLAKILCGLKKPASGEIFWCGKKVTKRQLNSLCFMVMQDVNAQLFAENVLGEVMLDADGDDPQKGRKRAEEILKECGLENYQNRHPMTLSGGQKQRLAVADALFVEKPVVIFDEPTSGLDYDHMVSFTSVLQKMAERGFVLIVITHDSEFIETSGAKVFRLS